MTEPTKSDPRADSPALEELLQEVRRMAADLLEQMQRLGAAQPESLLTFWTAHIDTMQELVAFLNTDPTKLVPQSVAMTQKQQRDFGRLVRDKRDAAGYSRQQLAEKANMSDSTLKHIETARHNPSRASLLRLLNVAELRLSWTDVPGQPRAPRATSKQSDLAGWSAGAGGASLLVLERMDFDELGDPVYVRRLRGPGPPQEQAVEATLDKRAERSKELSSPEAVAEIEYVPLRR